MRPADHIEESIKRLRYKTDAETHEKVLGNVMRTLDRHERQKSGIVKPDIWRTIMNTKMRKLATAAAILTAATIILYIIAGPIRTTSAVYAEVAERLSKALTLTYRVTTTASVEGIPSMDAEVAFKEPGLLRTTMGEGYVSVLDCVQGKGLSIIPPKRQFIEIDMSNLPNDAARRQVDAIEKLRSLPDRADEELGEREIDGRTVHGFRVTEEGMTNTVWIEPKTRELVLVETEYARAPGLGASMTDFRFNVELSDELFSLTPPDGYTRLQLAVDASESNEDDLIEFLRLWSTWTKDGTFPPTVNPVELAKVSGELTKAGAFGQDKTSEQERLQDAMALTRGVMFVMRLPTESNPRYVGENVKYGDAERPIFWYRPAGSQTYRVIYGDLNVKDVAPSDLPQ